MVLSKEQKIELNEFFNKIKLNSSYSKNQDAKINQIIAYLEVIHSRIRKYSYKRKLIFVEFAAGNCYLSYLVYYYYTFIDKRNIEIHCVDRNSSLMENNNGKSRDFGFNQMFFHSSDISNFSTDLKIDMIYSLHACDTATDKSLEWGIKNSIPYILSVSCCQHTIMKRTRSSICKGISKHSVFKDRMIHMIADAMRALLLESEGYNTDVFEFVSSKFTGKNVIIRAIKSGQEPKINAKDEYERIKEDFKIYPELENYLKNCS